MMQPNKTFSPMHISGAGICCSLGMSLTAVDCALRAGLDQFSHSNFTDSKNESLRVAQMSTEELTGSDRLAKWCALAIDESITHASHPQKNSPIDLSTTPLLLLAAERDRPHSNDHFYRDIFSAIQQHTNTDFHENSRIITSGRAGIGIALQLAQQWLVSEPINNIIIAGADSFLDSATINHYAGQQRLYTAQNSDGFIPGEAAAAIIVSRQESSADTTTILGVGVTQEQRPTNNTAPNRAFELTHALAQAITQSSIPYSAYTHRYSDQNGESSFAREAAHALTRLGARGLKQLSTQTTADCTGEIGAATGPLMLAWASRLSSSVTLGPSIAHLANDDGLRTAIALSASHTPHREPTL
ncbi:hypothetical protein [Gilvimarinus japonicus]|uniref:Uncharacterized protein n=1 Tax=Gilvimarinus japonicus TaxID=1796469 RepID=A0ABV7HWJ7_9GAMM